MRTLHSRMLATQLSTWLSTFLLCCLIFGIGAHWYSITNIDTVAAAWPSWEFAHHGTFYLDDATNYPKIPWFSDQSGHVVSNRMAGVVLIGVPLQVLMLPFDVSPLTPATLTALLTTSAAMANLALVLRRAGGHGGAILGTTAAVAFGTGFWTNASAELWPHGPDAFWLSLAMLAVQRDRLWLVGLFLSPALWTRPHLAAVAAVLGLILAATSRSCRPLLNIGIPTTVAMAGLAVWNSFMFGKPSPLGAYQGHADALVATGPSQFQRFVESGAGSLVSPLHGVLVFSPFVLMGFVALFAARQSCPPWMLGCTAGGVAYLLLQWKVNSFTGGTGLYSYRLPLEPILLCTPMASAGYLRWRERAASVALITRALVGFSVGAHAVGVFWFQPLGELGQVFNPWRTWSMEVAMRSRGAAGLGLAAVVLLVAVLGSLAAGRTYRPTSGAPSGSPVRPIQDLPVGG